MSNPYNMSKKFAKLSSTERRKIELDTLKALRELDVAAGKKRNVLTALKLARELTKEC